MYILHINENKSCLYLIFSCVRISSRCVCPNPKDNRWMSRKCLYHLPSLSLLSGHINFSSCSVISVSRDAHSIHPLFFSSLTSRVKFAVCGFRAASPVLVWGKVCDWNWMDAAFPGWFMALCRVFNSTCNQTTKR